MTTGRINQVTTTARSPLTRLAARRAPRGSTHDYACSSQVLIRFASFVERSAATANVTPLSTYPPQQRNSHHEHVSLGHPHLATVRLASELVRLGPRQPQQQTCRQVAEVRHLQLPAPS